jgi:uncharacterized protein
MQRSFLTTNHHYRETYGRFAWILLEGAMKTRRFLVVAILLFASSAPVWADDHAASVDALKTRAAQGIAEAQFALGLMYHNGQGIPQDYAEALKWYHLAAAQGDAKAQSNLGFGYYSGQGVPQDYAEALKWHRLAAAQGNADAQFMLGHMYDKGQGVPQDYVQAHKWYNLAAATSTNKPARDSAVNARDDVAARMTPAQLAEAQKLASEWKKQ